MRAGNRRSCSTRIATGGRLILTAAAANPVLTFMAALFSLGSTQFGASLALLAGVLAGVLVAGCGSKSDGASTVGGVDGPGHGQAGSTLIVVPNGDSGGSGGSTATYSNTLPSGFTAADTFGGYRLGAPVTAADSGNAGSGGSPATNSCGTTILAVIRDFKADQKNFEGLMAGDDHGLVKPDLGPDRKPVFAPSGPTLTVPDPAQFDSWYRNVDGLNLPFKFEIWFAPGQGVTIFQSKAFFPLDGAGFGNDGNDDFRRPHNFHFTTEIHTEFKYGGGEKFNFTGDDDVWVFINNKLAIDLGGIHVAEDASIDVDARAAELGLVLGNVYPFDMFQNERHTTESTFHAETSLNFVDCGTILPEIPK